MDYQYKNTTRRGLTKKDSAEELKISIETVKRAYRKIKDNFHIVWGSENIHNIQLYYFIYKTQRRKKHAKMYKNY